VDHPASRPELVRPWRTATLVASGIAALELVLLVVAGSVLLGKTIAPRLGVAAKHHATASKQAAPPRHQAAAAPAPAARLAPVPRRAATLPRAKTNVVVLNGNGLQGAAGAEASLVQARGYRVTRVANAPRGGYPKTIVMYRPGFAREARRFARDLHLGLVEPLDGIKPAALPRAQLVVILGSSR
jgi:hypothetical protein